MPSTASSAEVAARPTPTPARPAFARLVELLPLVAFVLYALTSPGLPRGAGAGAYIAAAALVERGRPALDGYIAALAPVPRDADAPLAEYGPVAYAAGHYQQTAPPGPALLAVPAYALGLLLAPLLGPDTPATIVILLAPLLGALTVAGLPRLMRRAGLDKPGRDRETLLFVVAGALLLWPLTRDLTAPLLVAALLVWTLPAIHARYRNAELGGSAAIAGLALGALPLLDYVAGVFFAVVVMSALLTRAWRTPRRALTLLAGVLFPALLHAWYGTVAFGRPWGVGFRYAVDPAARTLRAAFEPRVLGVLFITLVCFGLAPALARVSPAGAVRRLLPLSPALLAPVAALALVLAIRAARTSDAALPLDWRSPATLGPFLALTALLGCVPLLANRVRTRPWRAPLPAVLALLLVLPLPPPTPLQAAARAVTLDDAALNYAAPFAIETTGGVRPVWELSGAGGSARPDALRVESGARATSPWLDVAPGQAYEARVNADGESRLLFLWQGADRAETARQEVIFPTGAERRAAFAAPPGAAGLRLRLESRTSAPATFSALRLTLVAGARIEPFPEGRRAAFAFSFDWESAMGGLIHSRSAGGEGPGATVELRGDGGPSVAQAEEKALRMREGARFLAGLFARHGIHATFYATGYNLLSGNPECRKFLGDPVYRNVNMSNGWGSDWWRTHPWYGDDPCTAERDAPAWYFASETRDLAGAGHEIASHTFGHLYVRGVKPEELAADLEQWNRAAAELGLPPSGSFAFPWTSSNSLDAPFFAVFERAGMTILTRVYPDDLRHKYELDHPRGGPARTIFPALTVYPDQYLPSNDPARLDDALAGIDLALAGRGYFSVWTHPNEALEQGGQVVWSRVVDYAAAARDRGLWIAPVTEIVRYGEATRAVAVTALPVAGGARLTIENRAGRDLDGLTIGLSHRVGRVSVDGRETTALPGGLLQLPTLPRSARVSILVRR